MRIYVYFIRLCVVCIIYGLLLGYILPGNIDKKVVPDISDMSMRNMNPDDIDKLPKELKEYNEYIREEFKYFPVAYSKESNFVEYVNSWGYERSYGGDRVHEGTDIMGLVNKRGHYPIVSATDGVVEEIGWLELGGYRIGIRTKSGLYIYYAHLYSYAPDIDKGDNVCAGELLGYMGDSGYSKVEGTVGNFDVHLHLGIYVPTEEYGELSVNPYFFLKSIENNLVIYNY